MDAKFLRQVRTAEGKIKLVREDEKKRSGRDVIFRLLLPGVFVVMVFYRIFIMQPESGEFYTQLAARAMTKMYQSGRTEPAVKHQSVSNTPTRSSTAPVLPGWIV